MAVRVTLLGRPGIEIDGRRVEPAHDQRSALLYYVARAGTWVTRDEVLALFWADRPERKARATLRQLLVRTAQHPLARDLEVERTRLRWVAASDIDDIDAGVARLETWPGAFLDGFRLGDAREYEAWLALERATWDERWRTWAMRNADEALANDDPARAVTVIEAFLTRDPIDEAAFRAWCDASLRLGRRSLVAQRYEAFATKLQRELGVAPEDATRAAAFGDAAAASSVPSATRAIDDAQTSPSAGAQQRPWPQALVGREAEIADIEAALSAPGAIVSIAGAGGMGKTTLALSVARRLGARHVDGSIIASIAGVRDLAGVGQALRTALGIVPVPGRHPFDLAGDGLAHSDAVVVLDEIDTLHDPKTVVRRLREVAPGARWLLTARRRVDVEGAAIVEVGGLACPTSAADVTAASAAELFVRRVSRLGTHVDPTRDADAIVAICAACGGMPLALELAAGWARVLPLTRIAEELRSGIDLLCDEDAHPEAPHGSVRRVFAASWHALSDAARRTMVQLSVCHDGFDDAAARAVADAGLPQLLALRNAAFLSLDADGRYRQHPLLEAFVRERAASQEPALRAARERHARCYLARLQHWEIDGHGPEPARIITAVQRDHANVEAAWSYAIEHGWWDALKAGGPTLGLSYALAGRPARWNELHRAALAVVPPDSAAWAMLEVFDSAAATFEGRHEEAYARRTRALAVLHRCGSERDLAWGLFRHGMAAEAVGRIDEAIADLETSAALYRDLGEPHYLGLDLDFLHAMARTQREADERFALADAHLRASGNAALRAELLSRHAAFTARLSGRFADALAHADEALRLERAAAWSPLHEAYRLRTGAWVRIDVGDAAGAHARALEAQRLFGPFAAQFPADAHDIQAALAWAAWLLGDEDGSNEHLTPGAPAASTLEGFSLRVAVALEHGDLSVAESCVAAALALTNVRPDRWQQRRRRIEALVLDARYRIAINDRSAALESVDDALRMARVDPLVPSLLTTCAAALPLIAGGGPLIARALRSHSALPYVARRALPRDVTPSSGSRTLRRDADAQDPEAIAAQIQVALRVRPPLASRRKRSR